MRIFVFALLCFSFFSCENKNAQALPGDWQCVRILEEGAPLELETSDIKFSFTPDGLYTYQSTLAYREAGTYRLAGDKLYTRDTINANALEKVVKIALLTPDSLHFKMNDGGKERIMELVRAR